MKNINELMNEMKENNTMTKVDLNDLCDYNETSFLSDVLSEIADSCTDIYNNDLLEWSKGNYSYIEDALYDLGTPEDSKGKPDFIRMIQQGQYYQNYEEIQENLEDMLKFYMLNLLQKNDINELSEEQLKKLDELVKAWKNKDILGDIEDIKENLEV